ncbi:MAG: class I SAM-dependent DNA methyltransferase [Proteobacteria bacterium]|nr:class I SAM-dependent DNA methyltransferase [Pseudomonadota bacterium]
MSANANLNLLRTRAAAFAKDFAKSTYEMGEAQDFIRGLCQVFGLNHRRAVRFEERVKKLGGKRGRIDGFFPGLLLVEMKSTGEDLEQAYVQATDYFPGLKDGEVPRYVLVSDFSRLHLYDLEAKTERLDIPLADLPQHIEAFLFLAGYEAIATEHQEKINKLAAEQMAGMHDALKATGYTGQDLETYLVRLLFCLFADDTGLFGAKGRFLNLLVNHSRNDGTDLHGVLQSLFDTLNRPEDKRSNKLPEHLAAFPYVNGELFKGTLAQCYFDEAARTTLIDCAGLDWSDISPAIFGSLFQAIMHFDDEAAAAKSKKRREFGAHYTSEANILKAIRPLFLDDLQTEFLKIRRDKKKLAAFHQKLSRLNFFDPACGCGNFLVIAYRELRLLELDVIEALRGGDLIGQLDVDTLILCDVDQFHGIEIDGSAAQIAIVALWLTDHQMNLKVQRFGNYYTRIPLVKRANIVCGNALRLDWSAVLPPEKCSFIMGNPPFIGYSYQSKEQKSELEQVFRGMKGAGVLDYVAAWYIKAAEYIQANPDVPVAFVSTNSICQGEQVALLWGHLLAQGIKIHFAHRTFRWGNEGRGVAAVHCVIVGFGLREPKQRVLYDCGDSIAGEPTAINACNINPYLVDAATVLFERRSKPICEGIPEMGNGGKPTEGGNLLLSQEEVDTIQQNDPIAAKYIRPFLMGEEFINNIPRYCLWLKDSTAEDRINSPVIKERIQKVRAMRLASRKVPTQKSAEVPYLFGEIRVPNSPSYLAIPKVSSERRRYIPIGYLDSSVICGDKLFFLPDAGLYYFGTLCSTFHNAWMRTTCGRLKSDYSYSNTIVYNNFPWPASPSEKHKTAIEAAAQAILDARKAEEQRCENQGQSCSLATIYAPGNLPADLLKAHAQLDKAVDAAYGYQGGKDDAARVAFLFELYRKLAMAL